ncbi:MAG: hypothetical protein PHC75_04165 [Burkholderiales bacterium]|nr:hypothetical protein [Burkholderiales bacterium]
MNKKIALLLSVLLTTVVTGCNSGSTGGSQPTEISNSTKAIGGKKAIMYRELPAEVKGTPSLLVYDIGGLQQAGVTVVGSYPFKSNGIAAHPLVLFGTKYQIMKFLRKSDVWIDNQLYSDKNGGGLNSLYVGIAPYNPGDRFKEIFSIYDYSNNLISEIVGIFGKDIFKGVLNSTFNVEKPAKALQAFYNSMDASIEAYEGAKMPEEVQDELLDRSKVGAFMKEDDKIVYYLKITPVKQAGFINISDKNHPNCKSQHCDLKAIYEIINSDPKIFNNFYK